MQGTNYRTISNHFGLGRSTVCKCVHDISHAILIHLWQAYLYLPSPTDAVQSMHAWKQQIGIPGIVCAIDGTHIAIKRPCKDGDIYFNRKNFDRQP